MINFLNQLRELTDKIRGTNFKMVSTVVLTFMTFTWAMLASMIPRDVGKQPAVNEVVLGMLLGFLAAAWGINYKQFGKERDTDYGALERQAAIERAKINPSVTVAAADVVKAAGDVKVETPAPAPGTTETP